MKKIISIIMSVFMALCLLGACVNSEKNPGGNNGNGGSGDIGDISGMDLTRGYEYKKQSPELFQFFSSDPALDAFLNEYMERHLRYSEKSIGGNHGLQLGQGNTVWKEWEAMSVMWMNTNPLGYDPKGTIRGWLNNITIDEFGYVWMDNGTSRDNWGAGWAFPNSNHSYTYRKGAVSSAYQNSTYDFEKDAQKEWSATGVSDKNGDVKGLTKNGFLYVKDEALNSVTFETSVSEDFIANTYYAPFVEMSLNFTDLTDVSGTDKIEDIELYWKTEGDTAYSESKKVNYSTYSVSKYNKMPGAANLLFPMYAHPLWGSSGSLDRNSYKDVTGMKIVVKLKAPLEGEIGADKIKVCYDARQINNNSVYLATAAYYFKYTQDMDFLEKNMERIRKAMQFLLVYCDGDTGLVTTKNFHGHDGTSNKDCTDSHKAASSGESEILGMGSGIGDGYWDAISNPTVNSYCNNLYYRAIKAALYLEQVAENQAIDAAMPAVYKPFMDGKETYKMDSAKLSELLALSKEQYNLEFWDEEKGRYILGISGDDNATKVDYGFTLYNQEAIEAGIASKEQAESIMQWINGERKVAGDTSSNKDIYKYNFAPRFSTLKNDYQFWFRFDGTSNAYKWGNQIQNGGTAIHMAYYDLLATNSANGTEKAFSKLQRIQKWYENVSAEGGEADQFYRTYYLMNYGSSGRPYTLQGGGTEGAIGLDVEFLEAAILYTSIPEAFFGLDSKSYNTLNVKPNLPEYLKFWKMENLTFANIKYDLSMGDNFIQINSIVGDSSDLFIEVAFEKPSSNYEVRQHTKILTKNVDYYEEGDLLIVNVPLKNGRIQFLTK